MTIHAYRDESDVWYSLCGNDAADLTHDDTEVDCWECRSIIGISDETDIANNEVLAELVRKGSA